MFVEVTVRARLGEHLPKHTAAIDLHYPLHSLNTTIHFCSLRTTLHLKRDRQRERGCNENIVSDTSLMLFENSERNYVHLITSLLGCQTDYESVISIQAGMSCIHNTKLLEQSMNFSDFF